MASQGGTQELGPVYKEKGLPLCQSYPSKPVKGRSGLQANFTGRVTLSPRSTLPVLLTCFIMRDILCNVQDLKKKLKFSYENMFNSRKIGKYY